MKQTDEAKKRNQELVQLSCKKKKKSLLIDRSMRNKNLNIYTWKELKYN